MEEKYSNISGISDNYILDKCFDVSGRIKQSKLQETYQESKRLYPNSVNKRFSSVVRNSSELLDELKYETKFLSDNIINRPKCKHENCNKDSIFISNQYGYSTFCKEHSVEYNCSEIEYEVKDFFDSLNLKYIHNDRNQIGQELDFYFPDKNIAIAVNGCWFHSDRFKSKNYHKDKFQKCLDKNIELIYIWEDTWNQSKEIIQNYLKAKLGIFDKEIWARKTVIKEVSIQDSRKFLNENHLQGYCNAKYRYGLYYDNELVQIMTFGYSRFKKGEIELLRFCTKGGVKVPGGASKLLTAFLKNHPEIETIISYANCDISTGHIYKYLGFKYVHTTDNWSWLYKGVRINRFNSIRKKANELELPKCYSAGTMKFVLSRKVWID